VIFFLPTVLAAVLPFTSPQAVAPVPSSPAATPTASDAAARQKELLDHVRERIKGRETEPAEAVFRNIEILRGKPASRLPGMMAALTGLLGVTCTTCHVPGHFESEELSAKRTARQHFKMQAALNQEYFGGANAVSCWTCHRGVPKPPIQ